MTGSIIQLVANTGSQNQWISQQPEITLFHTIYRRHTYFASETIRIPISDANFNSGSNCKLLNCGDLINKMFILIELPTLSAEFINDKTCDLSSILKSINLSDHTFSNSLKSYSNKIEFTEIIDKIESTLNLYNLQERIRLNILSDLDNFILPLGAIISNNEYDFTNLKLDLSKIWLEKNNLLYPIYSYLKYLYNTSENSLLFESKNIGKILTYGFVFSDLIHNKEILLLHYSKTEKFDADTLAYYQQLNSKYSTDKKEIKNFDILDPPQNILNSYEIVINILQLQKCITVNKAINYSAFIDPNLKAHLITAINNLSASPYPNSYVQLVNSKLNDMFNSIETQFDMLFNAYQRYLPAHNELNLNTELINFIQSIQSINPKHFANYMDCNESDLEYLIELVNEYLSHININITEYVPYEPITTVNNINIQTDITKYAFTVDFSTTPSISDIFESCYEIISKENNSAKNIAIELYQSIYSHFQTLYESTIYQTKLSEPNYTKTQSYVKKFIQTSSMTEFYFIAENIIHTQFNYFYNNVFNITDTDNTVRKLLKIINSDDNSVITHINNPIITQKTKTKLLPVYWINKPSCQTILPENHTFCKLKNYKPCKSTIEKIISLKNIFISEYEYYEKYSGAITYLEKNNALADCDKDTEFGKYITEILSKNTITTTDFIQQILNSFSAILELYAFCYENNLCEYVIAKLKTHNYSIFNSDSVNTRIQFYFNIISEKDYGFIYEFFSYAYCNDINPSDIMNPISNFKTASNNKKDILINLIDDLWDYTIDINSNNFKDFDIDSKPSSIINKFIIKQNTIYSENKISKYIFENKEIIDCITDMCKKSIILIDVYRKQLIQLRDQVLNILYRNRTAKCAWIRKLGHYIMSEVTMWYDDQTIDMHPSDWFEIFHSVSKSDGQEYGYNKMIGNVDKLTCFDNNSKPAYTLVIPLIFYFNKNPVSSIPISACLNAKFELTVKFRELADLAFKEEFSSWVNYDDRCAFTPKICNAYVMAEYVYLSTDERRRFVTGMLEYIMEELQTDICTGVTDLQPVYQLGRTKKTKHIMSAHVKTQVEYWDPRTILYATAIDFPCIGTNPDVIDRIDFEPTIRTNKTGTKKMLYVKKQLVNPKIYSKRFSRRYYFGNLAKYIAVIIRPLIHIDCKFRTNELYYFHGEKQWSNFSLYSFYDLSKIQNAKKLHYDKLFKKIKKFDFVYLTNKVCIEETNDEFVNYVKQIQDYYVSYSKPILDLTNVAKLKDDLMQLNYNQITINQFIKLVSEHVNVQLEVYSVTHIMKRFINRYCGTDSHAIHMAKTIITRNIVSNHKYIDFKNIIWQIVPDNEIPYDIIELVCIKLNLQLNNYIDHTHIQLIDYQKNMILRPEINPLINGVLKFNDRNIMQYNYDGTCWSSLQPYLYMNHTPQTGINIFSWALKPLEAEPTGSANLSRIDNFTGVYDLHPIIGPDYPVEISTFVQSINLVRCLSGLIAKVWEWTTVKRGDL